MEDNIDTPIKKLVLLAQIWNLNNHEFSVDINDPIIKGCISKAEESKFKKDATINLFDLFVSFAKCELKNLRIPDKTYENYKQNQLYDSTNFISKDRKKRIFWENKIDSIRRVIKDNRRKKKNHKDDNRKARKVIENIKKILNDSISNDDVSPKSTYHYAESDQLLYTSLNPFIIYPSDSSVFTERTILLTDYVDSVLTLLHNRDDTLSAKNLQSIQNNLDTLLKEEYIIAIYKAYTDFIKKISLHKASKNSISDPLLLEANIIENDVEPIEEDINDLDWRKALVLGLSDYLIERTEQEALFIFYEQIYEKVLKPNTFIADTLFYNFSNLLKPFESKENIVFEANLDIVKEALNQDIDHLPSNITKHPRLRDSEGLVALHYTTGLLNELRKGYSLHDAFQNIVIEYRNAKEGTVPIERAILLVSKLIAYSDDTNLPILYKKHDTKALEPLSRLLIAFLSKDFPETLDMTNLESLTNHIKDLFVRYKRVKHNIKILNDDLTSISPASDFDAYRAHKRKTYLAILKEVASLLQEGVKFAKIFPDNENTSNHELNRLSNTVRNAVESWFLIKEKRYAEAMALIIPMLPSLPIQNIHGMNEERIEKLANIRTDLMISSLKMDRNKLTEVLKTELVDVKNSVYHFRNKNNAENFLVKHDLIFLKPLLLRPGVNFKYELSLPASITEERLQDHYSWLLNKYSNKQKRIGRLISHSLFDDDSSLSILPLQDYQRLNDLSLQYFSTKSVDIKLKRLLALAGEASTAKTAGDVKKVFQKYALPVASYRLKRAENSTLMLNAYVGGGISFFENDSGNFKSEGTWVLSAPVGLEYCIPFKVRPISSLSLFLPLIDVGNVINYRIEDSTDQREVQVEEIISPGGYLVFGLSRRFPLSLGVGFQSNPSRIGAFVAFDLPLFRIK